MRKILYGRVRIETDAFSSGCLVVYIGGPGLKQTPWNMNKQSRNASMKTCATSSGPATFYDVLGIYAGVNTISVTVTATLDRPVSVYINVAGIAEVKTLQAYGETFDFWLEEEFIIDEEPELTAL